MEKKIHLSAKQKEVIKLMRKGWICGVRWVYPADSFAKGKHFTSDTLDSLHRKGLTENNEDSIFTYHLTELGKTIEL